MHASTGQKKASSSNTTNAVLAQAWVTTPAAATPAAVTPGNAPIVTRIDRLAQLPGAGNGGCFELPLYQLLGNEEIDQLISFLERPDVQVTVLCLNLSGDIDPQALARLLAVIDARRAALGLRSLPVRVNGLEGGDIDLALRLELAKSKAALYLGGESVYALICPQFKAPWLLEHVKRFASVDQGPSNRTGWNDKPLYLSWQEEKQMWEDAVLVRAVATLSPGGRIGFFEKCPSPEQLQHLEQAQAPFSLKLFCCDDEEHRLSQWLAVSRPLLQALELSLPPDLCVTIVKLFKCQPSLRWAWVDVSRVALIEWTAHPTAPMAAGAVSLTLREGDESGVVLEMLSSLDPERLVLNNAGESMAKAFCEGLSAQCPRALLVLTLVWSNDTHQPLDKLASLLQGLVLGALRLELRKGLGCKPSELTELLLACVPLLHGFEVVDASQSSSPKRLFTYLATWLKEEWQHAAASWLEHYMGKGAKDVGKHIVKVGGFSDQDLRSMAMVQRRQFSGPGEATRKQQALAVVAAMRYRVGQAHRFDAVRDEQWMWRLGQAHTGLASDVYALLVNEPELRERFF